jgi:hypothetical protein|tara:strand:- start:7939 stop:8787 length:849 start_codon:yes stop_codon:yes gene_type:complete
MAQPSSRQTLIDYCKRQLGAPVLEINVADEQIDDLVDDALQYWNERHYDGVSQIYLKYKITQDDVNRGRAPAGESSTAGVTTSTASTSIVGTATTFSFTENSNYLQVPSDIIGIQKVFKFDGTNTAVSNMFSIKYQMFLNDIYYWGTSEVLTYAMTKTYLEDIDFLLTTEKQIRYNQRMDRLYLDIDWGGVSVGDYIVIDCYRLLNPNDFSKVWNDSFVKKYLTMLIKKQWGQNLIKFQGVKLPGGIELNGRQIYDDAIKEIDDLMEKMSNTYELPPLDMIG